MEAGDIIRITDVQRFAGYADDILNVYHYLVLSLDTPGDLQVYADDFAAEFYEAVMLPVLNVQSNLVTHTELRFWNLSNQLEEAVHVWTPPYAGLNVQDAMPANVSFSFKLVRYQRNVRNGRKAITGVPDIAVLNGKDINPAFQPVIDDVAEALAAPLQSNLPDFLGTFTPVIVRMPSNPGVVPTVYSPVLTASYTGVGTQNSRKEL